MNADMKKYNPYIYLNLDDSYYEDEVISYYDYYKEIYNNSKSFKKRVVEANDDEVKRLINEFLSKDGDVLNSTQELRDRVRVVKNIILITEDSKSTKKHISTIDKKVDKAINMKNKELKSKKDTIETINFYIEDFLLSDKLFEESLSEFKTQYQRIIDNCEKKYSLNESIKIINKINRLTNRAINKKMINEGIYFYDNVKMNMLTYEYDNILIRDSEKFISWVNDLKKESEKIKKTIVERYPLNKVKRAIHIHDKKIDMLIENRMKEIPDLYKNDEDKLQLLFEDYINSILNIEEELRQYDYYEYMTESEQFNIKRELYENKIRIFKGNIRNFNRDIRLKYSKRYASKYINQINKRADKLIKSYASKIGMPIPKNPWIVRKYLWADTSNFVSDLGIKLRKIIHKPLQKVVRLAMKNKLVVEEIPKYNPKKQYIFVSTHYFTEDVIGLFSATDRQTHMLMGTTDQIENNPLMIAAMLFGFFHVDRMDAEDRKECFEKQNILIDKGTSFINYIGGSWENSENELQPLSFSGAYRTSKMKDVLIIPVASYLVREDKKIYMRFGEPLDVRHLDESKANEIIRDTLASMHYKQMSKYSYPIENVSLNVNDKEIETHNLPYDQHMYYMNQIGNEYWNQPWTKPFAKEEIGVRKSKNTNEEEVYSFISNLSREKLIELSKYLSDVMVKMDDKERYNIIKYLDSNYEKFKTRSLKKKNNKK